MITTFLFKDNQMVTDVTQRDISKTLQNKETLLWLDLLDPTDEEITILSDQFKFHELVIEDCIFSQSPPKLDDFGKYVFLIIQAIKREDDEAKPTDLNIFFGANFVITVHDDHIKSIEAIVSRYRQNHSGMIKSSDLLLHAIIDGVVDSYLPLMTELDDRIELIEDEILSHPSPRVIENVLSLKKEVLAIKKMLIPQRGVIGELCRKGIPFINPSTLIYFRDIYDHLVRTTDTIDMYRESTTNILEVYMSWSSHQLNKVIKVLTVLATIMMPLTLITSYYGMNVDMPGWSKSLSFVWGVMTLTTAGLLVFFRRKKLL